MPILGYTLRAHPLTYDQHMKKLAALAALPLALTTLTACGDDKPKTVEVNVGAATLGAFAAMRDAAPTVTSSSPKATIEGSTV